MIFHQFCGEFPTEPNTTKIGTWVGVADIINRTKFCDEWLMDYKIKESQILPCSMETEIDVHFWGRHFVPNRIPECHSHFYVSEDLYNSSR